MMGEIDFDSGHFCSDTDLSHINALSVLVRYDNTLVQLHVFSISDSVINSRLGFFLD